jgi:Glycosyltransferase
MRNILWLASWYPNRLAPFDGDFIQRHAQAVAQLHRIELLFVVNDVTGKITRDTKEEVYRDGNLTERITYYHSFKTGIGFIDKILSTQKYVRIYKKAVQKYIAGNGQPLFVHLHVAMKAGIIAMWLQRKFKIPYILSEHWTDYLPEAKPNYNEYSFVFRNLCGKIFLGATTVTVVSKVLGEAIAEKFSVRYSVIPNVVNTSIFFPDRQSRAEQIKFVHISGLGAQKNIAQMMQAFEMIRKKNYEFNLTIFGPPSPEVDHLINQYALNDYVELQDEVPQEILAKAIQRSDALILYSNYETFGCVVIEANACGIPAILSNLPVFREYSVENKTAIFVEPANPEALADAMISFMKNREMFDAQKIWRHVVTKFSYPVIAHQFDALYDNLSESFSLRT